MNRLKELEKFGQSAWLDYLSRELLKSGELAKLIRDDGLKGMTSNPSIFQKAFAHGKDYDDDIRRWSEAGEDVGGIFRHICVKDIQDATDALRPVYDATHGADGFVSIEVSPYIAWDTQASVDEARSLWKEINRPNLMVKIPGTEQGIPAIRACLSEGININITLLFSQSMYEKVVEAYLSGLETLSQKGGLDKIASVASFFVSRIDSKVDAALADKIKTASGADRALLEGLQGKIAIANAKLAYQYFKKAFAGPRWDKLAAKGAKRQRLLWASTSTKNKAYPDTLYVDALIGADTVNTIPTETLDAFRDHGHPVATLESDVDGARRQLADLERAGISLDAITRELTVEGVELFEAAADKLYDSLADKREKILDGALLRTRFSWGEADEAVNKEIDDWTKTGKVRRIWAKDKSLWTGKDEDKWLGWLDVATRAPFDQLKALAHDVQARKFTDVVLIGMGGSSLGAEVFGDAFDGPAGWPKLHVLDSTDPDRIRRVEKSITLTSTLFLVASKSGSTLEPNLLHDYFFHLVAEKRGSEAGDQFVAITDPGSSLEETAKREKFLRIFHGEPEIGGRFSVLSNFGLVAATSIGLDIERFVKEARRAATSSSALTPADASPGIRLGIALGVLARDFGRDKITLIPSAEIATLGAWLEQLIAESTGKNGKGLIPVHGEPLGRADSYGKDRVFVHLHLAGCKQPGELLDELSERGHPVIRLSIEDGYQLPQMFFLWEMAIAAAGSVIAINPFDQPDVEAQKQKTREMTQAYERDGTLPKQSPLATFDGIALYADGRSAEALKGSDNLAEALRKHLGTLGAKDYFALLAYIEQTGPHEAAVNAIRAKVRDAKHTATVSGFGPRYLHSTGQAYKGGPNEGVFVTITAEHRENVPIANRRLDFGTVQFAQALGDFAVLNERGRRALRIHMKDIEGGLGALSAAIDEALA